MRGELKSIRMIALKFSNETTAGFSHELRSRVKKYFDERGITKYGNTSMVLKTVFMLTLFLSPYLLMITGIITHLWIVVLMWVLMGFGAAGIGLAVMHDANHKSYSKNKTVNRLLGYLLNLIGGHAPLWEIQHNIKHHGFTNIDGYDDDIDAGILLRFSPNDPLYKIHRFQHFYAWLLYCFMTLKWVTTKDFIQMFRYRKEGYLSGNTFIFTRKIAFLATSKLMYFGYILVLPILFLPMSWWTVLILFFVMQCITGFILSVIFQTAHVMPTSEYPIPEPGNTLSNSWAIHQIATTTNYAPKSRIFSWLIGGLNYQIEHHLFPNICHVHYRKLSTIVRETANTFKVRYNMQTSFLSAVVNHGKMLKQLGKA